MDMVLDGISPNGEVWLSIRREAEIALARDPIFGRSLSASILDHPDLGAAAAR
jgi:serine O-acetyltransferase